VKWRERGKERENALMGERIREKGGKGERDYVTKGETEKVRHSKMEKEGSEKGGEKM